MNENIHFREAKLWLERRRPERAVDKFREALTIEPDNGEIHAHYAFCLVSLAKHEDALQEAEAAIGLEPEWAFPHFVRSHAYMGMNKPKLAEQAIRQAIQLDPEAAMYWGTLAHTQNDRKLWREAIESAETGLELDPEDESCLSARAFAYIQSGRHEDADLTLETALHRDPEDAHLHAMKGWSHLQKNDPHQALIHYREALKLDPESDMARAGLVEALKARNLIYRTVLRWFLLLTRIEARWIFAIMIGTVFARRILMSAARAIPSLAFIFMSVFWLMVAFILLTWVAEPFFNLVLRLDPVGKHALTRKNIRQTNWLMGSILVVVLFVVLWLLDVPAMGQGVFLSAAMIIPLMTALRANGFRARSILWGYTAVLVLVGGIFLYLQHDYVKWLNNLEMGSLSEYRQYTGNEPSVLPSPGETERLKKEVLSGNKPIAKENKRRKARGNSYLSMFILGWVAFTWFSGIVLAKDEPD